MPSLERVIRQMQTSRSQPRMIQEEHSAPVDLSESFLSEMGQLDEATIESALAAVTHELNLLIDDARDIQKDHRKADQMSGDFFSKIEILRRRIDNITAYRGILQNCKYAEQAKMAQQG